MLSMALPLVLVLIVSSMLQFVNTQNDDCVFPFVYNNRSYIQCTTDGRVDGRPWCATTRNYDVDKMGTFCDCAFPFIYNGQIYTECTRDGRIDGRLWCATTKNFDVDRVGRFCDSAKKGLKTFIGICPGYVRLKFRYEKMVTLISKNKCAQFCIDNFDSEVMQVIGEKECHCSRVRSSYLLLFPQRYFECKNESKDTQILYREDRINSSLADVGSPMLFYALDDISGLHNIGSRQKQGTTFDAHWMDPNKIGHFDCLSMNEQNRVRLLRLQRSEEAGLEVVHSLGIFSPEQSFTVMLWFKVLRPGKSGLVESYNAQNENGTLQMWMDDKNRLSWWNMTSQHLPATFQQGTWNHMALRVQDSSWMGILNGRLVASENLVRANNSISLGDKMLIGVGKKGNRSYYWDGCLAHLMLFNKALNSEELEMMAGILGDDVF